MFNLPLLVAKRQEEGFSVPFVYSLSFDMAEVTSGHYLINDRPLALNPAS